MRPAVVTSTLIWIVVLTLNAQPKPEGLEHFEMKIRPLLAARCYACHSGASGKPQGGLRLDSTEAIQQGGNSGSLVDKANPEKSLILRALRHTADDLKMPPGKPLPASEVAEFERWVRDGAPMPAEKTAASVKAKSSLWSLQKPKASPTLPTVRDTAWPGNEIDRFVLAKLEEKGLKPSARADKRTLIRRATYDLTGLPATVAEINAFVLDNSPKSYERLLDRLLASPHYGERWGRHWLDVARYSDARSPGERFAWSYTYRDWVIRALNEDLPYDQFLVQQLAADRIPGNDPRHLAALGYLSLGRDFPKSFPETVDDRIDAVSRGMLGLTVSCARCHDHKYDPIPTKDYYSFYSIFSNIREPEDLPVIGNPLHVSAKNRTYESRLRRLRQSVEDYRVKRLGEMIVFFKTQIGEYLLAAHDAKDLTNTEIEELVRTRQLNLHLLARFRKYLTEAKASRDPVFSIWNALDGVPDKDIRAKVESLLGTEAQNRLVVEELRATPVSSRRQLAERYASILTRNDGEKTQGNPDAEQLRLALRGEKSPVNIPLKEFELIYTEGDSNNTRALRNNYSAALAMYAYDGAPPHAMAVEDVPEPQPAHVFLRGNPNNPGVLAPAHYLSALSDGEPALFREGSGRLELARAIANRDNPVTARVLVNRVWMHHFGAPLVGTPSDFGLRGDLPTHPELLDHLAVSFMEDGWSIKKLHRTMMLSQTYQQSSADNPQARGIDPENQFLWHMNRRRLEFESLRDSMLTVAGRLDETPGGPPYLLTALPSVPRRTVYGYVERGRIPAMLSLFDFPTPDQHAPMRYTTTVPQQALFFLNSPFVSEQARNILKRPDVLQIQDPSQRVQQLYKVVLARDASPLELTVGLKYVGTNDSTPEKSDTAPVWQYGIGKIDGATGQVTKFEHFRFFTGDAWQGASMLPDPIAGKGRLRLNGGEPGEDMAVIRRWISPVDGRISVEGTLRHNQRTPVVGDGVRGRIVSSRTGEIALWIANGFTAETKITGVEVKKGDLLDFVVDGRNDPEVDDFTWAPTIKLIESGAAPSTASVWNAAADFRGPEPERLTAWERYAQVLLQTNEFAFVD